MMKKLRIIATLLLHGPVLGMAGNIYGTMMAFHELGHLNEEITISDGSILMSKRWINSGEHYFFKNCR